MINLPQRSNRSLRRYLQHTIFNPQRWRIELSIFASKKYWVIPCIITQYIHSISTNIAYYRHVQMPTLKDWGYETIPALPSHLRWISEFIFCCIFFSILFLGFLPFFQSPRPPKYYMATIWIRVLFVLFICIFLRSFSFLATSLPGPAPHCQPFSKEYSPPETIYDIIFNVDILHGCGDLVYSSHTMIAMTFVLAGHYYLDAFLRKKVYLCLMYGVYWPLLLMLSLCIVAARKHYTVDVIVALYVTPLVFHASFKLMGDMDARNIYKMYLVRNGMNGMYGSKQPKKSGLIEKNIGIDMNESSINKGGNNGRNDSNDVSIEIVGNNSDINKNSINNIGIGNIKNISKNKVGNINSITMNGIIKNTKNTMNDNVVGSSEQQRLLPKY